MFCESLLFVGCDDVKLSEAVVLSDVVRAIHVDGAVPPISQRSAVN